MGYQKLLINFNKKIHTINHSNESIKDLNSSNLSNIFIFLNSKTSRMKLKQLITSQLLTVNNYQFLSYLLLILYLRGICDCNYRKIKLITTMKPQQLQNFGHIHVQFGVYVPWILQLVRSSSLFHRYCNSYKRSDIRSMKMKMKWIMVDDLVNIEFTYGSKR